MAGFENGVLLGQPKQEQDFFNANNMYFFSVGAAFSGKLLAVFGQANEIVDRGGECEIRFKFNNGGIVGIVQYKIPGQLNRESKIYANIYELVEVVSIALQETIDAK